MVFSLINKFVIVLMVALSLSVAAFAQTVNGVPISQIDSEYIQIVVTNKLLSTKVTVDIDFGQRVKVFAIKDTEIRDENNKPLVFNSAIDALNFMSANGYEFVQVYTEGVADTTVHYYLMRKKKKE